HKAGVEGLAALRQPFENFAGAVDCGPFLVASDQEANRTVERGAALIEETLRRPDKGGDRAFHIDRTAAAQRTIAECRTERIEGPGLGTPGGYNIAMTAQAEVARAGAGARREALDSRAAVATGAAA